MLGVELEPLGALTGVADVHIPLLISRVTSSTFGSSVCALTWMFLKYSSKKPSLRANFAMMVWSGSDSHTGSTILSRHWIERFDAVTEP